MSMTPKRKGEAGVKAEGKAAYRGLTPTRLMAGVGRGDVGFYEHVAGCGYTCSLGKKPGESEREPESGTQTHEGPPFREGGRQRRLLRAVPLLKESSLEFVT